MDKFHIRDYFFTLSGYFSNTIQLIKMKYKIVLTAFCVYALFIIMPIIIFGRYYSTFSEVLTTNDMDTFINVFLIMMIFMIIYMLLFFFVQVFIRGVVYAQCRSYADNCLLSFKESLLYAGKRLGSYITASLSQWLIYMAAGVVLSIYIMLIALFGVAAFNSGNDLLGVIVILSIFIGYIAFVVLIYFIMIKLFFSLHISLNYNYGGFNALSYSNKLTKGFKGKIFGYIMLFAAISFGISMVLNTINMVFSMSSYAFDMTMPVMNPWLSILSSFLMAAIYIFSMIFFNFVFINIDSVKKKIPSAYDPLIHGARDAFYEYCLSKGIKTDYIPPNQY